MSQQPMSQQPMSQQPMSQPTPPSLLSRLHSAFTSPTPSSPNLSRSSSLPPSSPSSSSPPRPRAGTLAVLPNAPKNHGINPDYPSLDTEAYAAIVANSKVKVTKLKEVLTGKSRKKGFAAAASPESSGLASSNDDASAARSSSELICVTGPSFPAPKKRRGRKGRRRTSRRSYVKGKVIDGKHELYALSIAMMLGLRHAIFEQERDEGSEGVGVEVLKVVGGVADALSRVVLTHTSPAALPPPFPSSLPHSDFSNTAEIMFPPRGNKTTPPHTLNHTFKFKTYCPVAFRMLRSVFGIDSADFLMSICGNSNFIEFMSNARSGQFFFYSHDGRYMIKTMTGVEAKYLESIMPSYYEHCAANPDTLITRFMGLYKVKMYHLKRNVKFVIMGSVFDTDVNLTTMFDLKGSSLGRDAGAGDAVQKDNDLRARMANNGGAGFTIKDETILPRLKAVLQTDLLWLRKVNIIDYSMLIGVGTERIGEVSRTSWEDPSTPSDDDYTPLSRGGQSRKLSYEATHSAPRARISPRLDGGFELAGASLLMENGMGATDDSQVDVLFLGIIDILQQFNSRKILESSYKSLLHKRESVSCSNPKFYAARFMRFFGTYMGNGDEQMDDDSALGQLVKSVKSRVGSMRASSVFRRQVGGEKSEEE